MIAGHSRTLPQLTLGPARLGAVTPAMPVEVIRVQEPTGAFLGRPRAFINLHTILDAQFDQIVEIILKAFATGM
jgi:hypothetical protein